MILNNKFFAECNLWLQGTNSWISQTLQNEKCGYGNFTYKQKKVTGKCALFVGGYSNSEHLAYIIEFHNSTEGDMWSVS